MEFSADSWQASSPGLQKSLAERGEALDALLQGLVNLAESGTISGQGADAMRAYIREVHVPIVQSLLVCLSTFQTAIGVYWSGYSQVDADGNFRLVNDEYDAHVTQLDTGIGRLRGFAADLRSIAASASHLVSLDGAGAGAADNAAEGFERMRSIAKTQQETWAAYEATDPGFTQVKNLVAEVNRVVANLGSLTVGQGRSYLPGSFTLTLRTLGELTGGMLEYCRTNQQVASDGWQALFSGYVDDVEADAERQRKEDAVSGLLWDGLQTVAGAVLVTVGVVGTPFSAGVSLALAGLGGSLIAGGVNSAIDHATIASTGESLNLVGMASQGIGHWYDVTLAQPAIASGDHDLQFLVGAGSGLGDQVSGALQLNMHDTVTGVFTLATNGEAFSQFWNQLTTTAGKAASGDAFVLGQIAGNLLPLGALTKATTLDNLLTKADDLGRLTTKADDLDFGKHVTIAAASDATSAMDWLKNHLGAGRVTVSDEFTPTIRPLDPIDGSTVKSRSGGPDFDAGNRGGGGDQLSADAGLLTLKQGELPRAGESWRGQTEGGPGIWEKSPKRTGGIDYQEFITSMERGTEYRVNGVHFDGYDPIRHVLTDAKDWQKYPPIAADFWQEGTLTEIKKQVAAAGDTPVEWHFSTEAAKQAVDLLLRDEGFEGAIRTVHTPY
nr:T7SS effector LXG polymorphic toxin [Rathayibacter rathayi]